MITGQNNVLKVSNKSGEARVGVLKAGESRPIEQLEALFNDWRL